MTNDGDFSPFAEIPPGQPCADAAAVSVTQLENQSDVDVVLADDQATDADIVGASFCDGDRSQPVVTYTEDGTATAGRSAQRAAADSMWVFYEDSYPEAGRVTWLHDLADQSGGTYVEIDGAPAFIAPSSLDPDVRNQVLLTVPGSDRIIRIQSPSTVTVEELTEFARSFPTS